MARVARMTLDVAIVSLKVASPAVCKVWTLTKDAVGSTAAKPIVNNAVITKLESSAATVTDMLIARLKSLRDQLLPMEEKYLEKQLELVKKKMRDGDDDTAGKTLRPAIGTAWQYAKTEIVPPMTLSFFHGPAGRGLENSCATFADGLIATLEKTARGMDAAAEKAKKDKEAALKAAAEKAKAMALEEAKKTQEAEKAAQAKKAAAAKKPEPKAEAAKKPDDKKKPQQSKKAPPKKG